ncbi:MAG: acyl transferase [Thermonemataceae bacterium]|nr:acyl transferase [Thermonemataceae bacterium]
MLLELKKEVLQVQEHNFEQLALKIFRYQITHNRLYAQFLVNLGINASNITKLEQIPCLPIEFFKDKEVRSIDFPPSIIFESSGTTQTKKSRHLLTDIAFYRQNSLQIFEQNYGEPSAYHILALLPSYQEQGASSLVFMVEQFMKASASPYSNFYLYDWQNLYDTIRFLQNKSDRKILLIGVTFALLDFAEAFKADFSDILVMETGGMKGRRREMIREEVHSYLCEAWNLTKIHSEYGMTELLSQAYSKGEGVFEMPNTMKILLRETNDPLSFTNKRGLINVIDLANIETCSFIATQDVGTILGQNQFKVLGRADNTEQRGCNLLIIS